MHYPRLETERLYLRELTLGDARQVVFLSLRGRGLMREAVEAALAFGFGTMALSMVCATAGERC